jgi:hypothetical protein
MSAVTATTATTANNFSGLLSGDVAGTQGATTVASVGGQTAANVAGGASAANAATSANTANTIVKRDSSGSFAAGAITASSFSGDGAGLTNINLAGLTIQQNGLGAPNVIAGSPVNCVAGGVVGATIGGGGATDYYGSHYTNSVTRDFGTVGGGEQNTASGYQSLASECDCGRSFDYAIAEPPGGGLHCPRCGRPAAPATRPAYRRRLRHRHAVSVLQEQGGTLCGDSGAAQHHSGAHADRGLELVVAAGRQAGSQAQIPPEARGDAPLEKHYE